jgi:asparagine synthase (glutamine-hydrolysing)
MQLQFTVGADTIFAGIQRVQPGEVLYFERGQLTKRHQNPCFTHIYQTPQADKTTADMQAVLQESVQVHQRSDVPFGMFLSGGIDSSSILALMAQLNESPVVAYTAGFPDAEVADERSQAEKLAKAVGADHHGITVTEHDFRNRLPQIAAAMDDPVADYAIVPTFLLAEAAKKDVTVVLSGEGGDELFGGYGRYRAAMRRWPLNKAMRRKGALDAKGLGIHLWRASPTYWRDGYAHAQRLVPKTRTKLQSLQAVDCRDWLSHDLLTKLDRCLMAHSLEGRTPFLDPKVAAFALPLPDHQKIHQHMGKYLLRQWLAEVLPEAMPFAPKQGFTVPVGQWVDGLPHIGELVAAQAGIQQFFKPDAVKTLFAARAGKKVGFAKWALLFFALWHQYHIAHVPADGDILSVLAAR